MPSKTTVAVSLTGENIAMLRAYAKDNGDLGMSGALRAILADWQRMRRERVSLARDACCDEEARALLGMPAIPDTELE